MADPQQLSTGELAFGSLIAAIREHCPDDEQTRQAIDGLMHLSAVYPTLEDAEHHIDAVWWTAVSEMKQASLERRLKEATNLDEVRELTRQIEDARRLRGAA